MDYIWKHGEWKCASKADTPAELTMRNKDGERMQFNRYEPYEAERTLEVKLAPNGNEESQFQYMRKAAEEWEDLIQTGNVPRHLAWRSWQTSIMKTFEYPLSVRMLTEDKCRDIMKPIFKAGLPHSGFMQLFAKNPSTCTKMLPRTWNHRIVCRTVNQAHSEN